MVNGDGDHCKCFEEPDFIARPYGRPIPKKKKTA